MIQWTTPTLRMRLLRPDKTVYDDLVFDYILLTITSECTVIEKTIPYSEVEQGIFNVHFTQEETGQLKVGEVCEAMLNIMASGERIGTRKKRITVSDNLHKAVIADD